ncbi:MAG: LPS export ABC transporter periplasmic protein LptC [Pseudomonadales bacterium]|nr:LPS export ABC transporter periplasmic protein LptC [Pseudomonadales bacterium]
MSSAARTATLWALVLGLVAWMGWTLRTSNWLAPPAPQAGSAIATAEGEPDLSLTNAQIIEFAEDGSPAFHLRAAGMAQRGETDEASLEQPYLLVSNAGGQPWDVTSRDGTIRRTPGSDGRPENLVELRKDVVLRQLRSDSAPPSMTIRSEAIDVYPERQFAKSPVSVMIDSDVGRTLAATMQGSLKTGVLDLASDRQQPVYTIVLPTQFKSRLQP